MLRDRAEIRLAGCLVDGVVYSNGEPAAALSKKIGPYCGGSKHGGQWPAAPGFPDDIDGKVVHYRIADFAAFFADNGRASCRSWPMSMASVPD